MKSFKNSFTAGALSALLVVGVAGGMYAYFTDSEKTVNNFTIGDVQIEALEENYPGNDSTAVKDARPNQEVDKDPKIANRGVTDAIVFMTLDSPIENITLIDDDGSPFGAATTLTKAANEIFWFKDASDAISTHANNFDSNWTELPTKEMYVLIAQDGTETVVEASAVQSTIATIHGQDATAAQRASRLVKRYVFAYKTEIQGSNTSDGDTGATETSTLFEKVQLKNMMENEIDNSAEQIVIRNYAIQSDKLLENNVDLGGTLNAENFGKIYDIFIRQNSTSHGTTALDVTGMRDADSVTATSDGASGTTDQHVNRWDTDDNVSGAGDNIKPNNP